MDPLSITTGCDSLVSTIGSVSVSLHAFVRTCREARSDLDRVSRELHSLRTVLELIQEDAADQGKPFPPTLAHHVSGIVTNCTSVVQEVQTCITKYGDGRRVTKMSWTLTGQGDMEKLRSSLEAHKSALELALDMLALALTKEIKNDTTEIRNDTAAIKDDTAQILQEIARLQARLPNNAGTSNDFLLQKYLEEMTTYTEQELDATLSGDEENSRNSRDLSYIKEYEETVPSPREDAWEISADHSSDNNPPVAPSPPAKISLTMAQHTYPSPPRRPVAPSPSLIPNQATPRILNYSVPHGQTSRPRRPSPGRPSHSIPYTAARQESQVIGGVSGRQSGETEQSENGVRFREVTPFQSYMGNLVIDCPIPDSVLETIPHGPRDEFTHWRFTAVTCPPEEFTQRNYVLRNRLFAKPRDIKIVLFFLLDSVETSQDFTDRWHLIASALNKLRARTNGTSDVDVWKRVVVYLHSPDRWERLHPDVVQVLEMMLIKPRLDTVVNILDGETLEPPYSEDSTTLKGRNVYGIVREYTTQVRPRSGTLNEEQGDLRKECPVQTIATSLNIHPTTYHSNTPRHWVNGIGKALMPGLLIDMTSMADVQHASPEFLSQAWFNEVPQKAHGGSFNDTFKTISLGELNKKPKSLRSSVSKFARNLLS